MLIITGKGQISISSTICFFFTNWRQLIVRHEKSCYQWAKGRCNALRWGECCVSSQRKAAKDTKVKWTHMEKHSWWLSTEYWIPLTNFPVFQCQTEGEGDTASKLIQGTPSFSCWVTVLSHIVETDHWINLQITSRESITGLIPSPVISNSYLVSSMSGTGRWLRMKKISLGVMRLSDRSCKGGSALKGFLVLTFKAGWRGGSVM